MAASWYSDADVKATVYSVSHVCNNLSTLGDALVYVHEDDVVFAEMSKGETYGTHLLPVVEKSWVHEARLCRLMGTTVVVVATDNGLQVYDDTGRERVFQLALKNHVDAGEDGSVTFCRGICAVNSDQQSSLVVGSSVGKCFVLGADKSAKAASVHDIELVSKILNHKEAIQSIDSTADGAFIASSDDGGAIVVSNTNDNFSITRRIPGSTFPATTLRFTPTGWLVAGDLTGLLRVYHKDSFLLYAEVAAHTRAITALDVSEDHIASVSEDTFMNVWEFTESKPTPRIKLVSSQCVANDILVGVAFKGNKKLVTTAYDTSHVKHWVPM